MTASHLSKAQCSDSREREKESKKERKQEIVIVSYIYIYTHIEMLTYIYRERDLQRERECLGQLEGEGYSRYTYSFNPKQAWNSEICHLAISHTRSGPGLEKHQALVIHIGPRRCRMTHRPCLRLTETKAPLWPHDNGTICPFGILFLVL